MRAIIEFLCGSNTDSSRVTITVVLCCSITMLIAGIAICSWKLGLAGLIVLALSEPAAKEMV